MQNNERPIRILVAKPGLDGHDRGAKVIARALRDAGMEVIYNRHPSEPADDRPSRRAGGRGRARPQHLSGAHLEILPEVMTLLQGEGMDDVLVVVGGIIPAVDRQPLKDLGITEVFGPGTSTGEIVEFIRESMSGKV